MKAFLVLEDGRWFAGTPFGALGEAAGEIVFNTGLTGYQEILTDPSYSGQIVTLTYPHIGNYGVNGEDVESARPRAEGLVVREVSPIASNHRASGDLDSYLREHDIPAMAGVDTRALTRHLRARGAMRAVLTTSDEPVERLVERARRTPEMVGSDLVRRVTCRERYVWEATSPERFHVVAYDFGIKWGILRSLTSRGIRMTVVPAETPAKEALALKPDGVLLSNGPGDPEPLSYAVHTTRELLGQLPLFGICLGHQVLALAVGGRTYKLPFGHHGANHPVRRVSDGAVEITSQNHGFSVDAESLRGLSVELTHHNLNDGTLEGFRLKDAPAMSIQYHPEASPGPYDARYLFDRFIEMMEQP
ncbi:MAG: glutamine-hydrolyzing carbamoyl-phosphate synthase small subunit [Acidobacteriota bacterium]